MHISVAKQLLNEEFNQQSSQLPILACFVEAVLPGGIERTMEGTAHTFEWVLTPALSFKARMTRQTQSHRYTITLDNHKRAGGHDAPPGQWLQQ